MEFFSLKVSFHQILSFLFKKKTIITPIGIFETWSLNQKKMKKNCFKFVSKIQKNKVNAIHVTSAIEKENLRIVTTNKKYKINPTWNK